MKLLIGASNIKPEFPYPVVAIGNFDGLHLGHQAILTQTMKRAKENDGTSILLTFEPHPRRLLQPEKTFKLLYTYQSKMRLIENTGIDLAYTTEFNKAFLALSPEAFSKNFLYEKMACKEVVVGKNFRFGKDRAGTLEDLVRFGKEFGFKVVVQDPVWVDGNIVSSSQVRKLVKEGDVRLAGKMLG
ncbi:MAG: bifunctional riboflavin kinase/FAD synthetase, partial [Nitrospiria bacterium]